MMAIAGALIGGGLLLMVRGAVGPTASLPSFVEELHRPRTATLAAPTSWVDSVLVKTAGQSAERHRADLDICERTPAKFAQDRLAWAAIGAAPGILALGLSPTGIISFVPPMVALLLLLVGAVAGWIFSVFDLRSDAEVKRREFRHALTAYLELVAILQAGGAGTQSALYDAATIGRGSGFRHLKTALSAAQSRREAPWETLGVLGQRLGVSELVELKQSMTLAGDGARVRESLRAKADAMRDKARAQQESEAEKKSESMVLPVVMTFVGFLLLIGYPAISGLSATA
ncbi:MAG: hypothetical protein WA964_00055 [Ilumatobacter sp.]|uniref:secretion system protein n=1 Tax=Ilumatobacter sp. TaxID=1967498 RepID=UPI003C765EFC